jgi:CheY-like chemotaxis protein
MNILVVDDDKMLREAYSLILSAAGHSVSTAYDGLNALKKYKNKEPDLILLDMMMPNLDGLGFLKQLYDSNEKQEARIIIFSNLSESDKIDEAMTLGAEKHITKSQMTPQELILQIKEMFPGA